MHKPNTIAIDGPAGSGKSTISQQLADHFGYTFVDTGAFYRAITYLVLQAEIALDDLSAIAALVERTQLRIQPNKVDSSYAILANNQDVTDHLQSKTVEDAVSIIAKMPVVRTLLLPLQRQVAAQGNIILAGRDIGTVVLPDADLKLYIDASLEERARRRHHQWAESGKQTTREATETALARRDRIDSERSAAPLALANDAVYIMTDNLTIEDVIAKIHVIIETWCENSHQIS